MNKTARNTSTTSAIAPVRAAVAIALLLAVAPSLAPADVPIFGPRKLLFENEDSEGSTVYYGFHRTDGEGAWIATLSDLEVTESGIVTRHMIVRSDDDGETWSAPMPMFSEEWYAQPGGEGLDFMWVGPGEWLAHVSSSRPVGGGLGFIRGVQMLSRSTDDGQTWSDPVLFSEVGGQNPEVEEVAGFHSARGGSGTIVATWIEAPPYTSTSPVFYDTESYATRSFDGGRTWETPTLMPTNASSNSNCRIATAGDGRWMIVWNGKNSHLGVNGYDTDVYARFSSDDGATWGEEVLVNSTAALDSLSNDALWLVESDGADQWMAMYVTEFDVEGANTGRDGDAVAVVSNDNGATWGNPVKAQALWHSDELSESPSSLHALGGGQWFAAWSSYKPYSTLSDPDWEWQIASTNNGGASWAEPTSYAPTDFAPPTRTFTFHVERSGDPDRWLAMWNSIDHDGRSRVYYSLGSSSRAGENATGIAVK